MSDYIATARTNYFRVTDEGRYEELKKGLSAEGGVLDISKNAKDGGGIFHGFAAYGGIDWLDPEDDEPESNIDYFLEELQKILPEDEAFIYQEIGSEKMRYVTGVYCVVTKAGIEWHTMSEEALQTSRKLLKNKEFKTQMDY